MKVWWVITNDLSAPPHNLAPLHLVIANELHAGHRTLAGVKLGSWEGCQRLFTDKAPALVELEMKRLVREYQMLPKVVSTSDVLFSRGLTSAAFINWEAFSEHPVCIPTWNLVSLVH